MTDLERLRARNVAEQTAREIGRSLGEGFGSQGHIVKDGETAGDLVTTFDLEAEDRFAELLGKFDQSFGFCGEEMGHQGSRQTFWLVDALGGTGHFIRGTLFSSSMVSLIDNDEVVVAVIHDFVNNRMFSAAKNQGSTCNGEQIRVSDRELNRAYIAAEVRFDTSKNARLLEKMQQNSVVVSMANYGWDFTMTASGKLDGVVTKDPWGGAWDFAPGALLVEEAGGVVTDLAGGKYNYQNLDLIAAPPRIHEELLMMASSIPI